MPFEEFTKKMAREADAPYVTIQKRGVIALNHSAFVALGEPNAVVLLFDAERQAVGLRAAAANVEHAYKVRLNTKGSSHLVTATLFTNHYGISTQVARRWEAQMEGDILTIDLTRKPISGPTS
jgi:hypothetical protein